jgi:hypothetical protein
MEPESIEREFLGKLNDLVLDLKGLVLVRGLLEQRGASVGEIEEHSAEIERVRERLATLMRGGSDARVAAA